MLSKIETYTVKVKSRKQSYTYSIIRIYGQYYFSPFGVYGNYENLLYDYNTHIIPHAKAIFKNELNDASFKILGNFEVQLDHVLKEPFRTVFGLDSKTSHAVIVPSILNAERTNKKPKEEFALFDIRIKGP